MTPDEWKEAQRPGFEAWWTASGRDPAWCSRRDNGSYDIRMVEICWRGWLAAKAEPVEVTEVTEEMVERATDALAHVPDVWCRTNKMREDGLIYEVGYTEDDKPISDDTIHILGATHHYATARDMVDAYQSDMIVRAVLSAALNPVITRADEMGGGK